MSDVDAKIGHLLVPWLSAQTKLREITRWSRFYEHGNRRQDAAVHSLSAVFLALPVLDQIGRYQPDLDQALILGALAVHDFGEGELGRDILWPDKGLEHDIAEYEAFVKMLGGPENADDAMLQRFLLQFARKGPEYHARFPERAQTIFEHLKMTYGAEAELFEAIEYLDYMLYILEQIREGGTLAKAFKGEIHTVIDVLSRAAEEIPGFHEVWTPELDVWARSLMPEAKAAE